MKTNKSGMALVTVMCFILLIAMASAFVMMTAGSHMIVAKDQSRIEKAQFVAEAGAEMAASHIVHDGAVPVAFAGAKGDGTYCVTIIKGASPSEAASTNGSYSLGGSIEINPNNSADNEFTVTLSTGGPVTRDMLTQNYAGYAGNATLVHVKPKGNGGQNGLVVNGVPFSLENSHTYDISSAAMSISIYNDKVNSQGKAMGKWHIAIAATEATITDAP